MAATHLKNSFVFIVVNFLRNVALKQNENDPKVYFDVHSVRDENQSTHVRSCDV